MKRLCLVKLTGKIIEMQGGGEHDNELIMDARLETLRQNAINAGYAADDIEVKWTTDEEWAAIEEANKPIPTYAELRRSAYPDFLDYLDAKVKQADPDRRAEGIAQEAEYLAACLAVKEQYPKPA